MKINANTKMSQAINARYNYALRYGCSDLYEAYKNPSVYKWRAYHRCLQLCSDLNGYNFRISGYNCMSFSVTFAYPDPETGEIMVAWITKDYDRFTPMS